MMRRSSQDKSFELSTRRIALINSYRMGEARRLVELGAYPAQHLWGTWNLSSAWETEVTDLCMNYLGEKRPKGRFILKQIERVIGDPVQAIWAITGPNKGSVVYAANPKSGTLVGLLKRLRVLAAPYVVLVHSYPVSGWAKWCLKGADAILVFSASIKEKMRVDGFAPDDITVAHWGPDLEWPEYDHPDAISAMDFISAGKTNRDYKSVRALAEDGKLSGHVLDGSTIAEYKDGQVHISPGRPGYPEVVKLMASARVVFIPLRDPSMLSGLTEVCDAIALGKPVVMSRNDWMPIDIELVGIGVWLNDQRPESVLEAISLAAQIPREEIEQVAQWFNMHTFSKTLEYVLDSFGATNRNLR